jgi:ribonuclease BN (tRNA processing enzyme)
MDFARAEDKKLTNFLRGVDVLILDAQYDAETYHNHAGWGHGCVDDAVELAMRAEAKRLFLFHHDPDHDDQKLNDLLEHGKQIAASRGSELQVEAAREGETWEFSRGA